MEANNIQLARRIIEEGFGNNNPGIFDKLAADNFLEHQRGMEHGVESTKAAIGDLHTAFPDMGYKLVNAIASDDMVCVHYRASGTQTGSLGPMPPTGKTFEIDVIDIMRFENGKLMEHWGSPDRLGLMEDLGFWPPQGA